MPLFKNAANNTNTQKTLWTKESENSIFRACFEKKRFLKEIFITIHPLFTKKKIRFKGLRHFLLTKTLVRKGFFWQQSENNIKMHHDTIHPSWVSYLSLNYKEQRFYSDKKNAGSSFFSFGQQVSREKKNEKIKTLGIKKKNFKEGKEKRDINFETMRKFLWSFMTKAFHKGCDFYEVDKFFRESRLKKLAGKDFFSMFILRTYAREKIVIQNKLKCCFCGYQVRFCVHFKYSLKKKYTGGNPCSSCPTITECHPQGIVNPFDCIFLKKTGACLQKY